MEPWQPPVTTPASTPDEPIKLIGIRETPLSWTRSSGRGDDAAGGTALFVGTVRNHDGGADVEGLAYSCHPARRRRCGGSPKKVVAEYPVRGALAAVHRVGELEVGDLAVVVGVSCPHRAERSRPAGTDRRPQAPGADLEAPEVLRRHRGSGWAPADPRQAPRHKRMRTGARACPLLLHLRRPCVSVGPHVSADLRVCRPVRIRRPSVHRTRTPSA